MPIDHWYNHPVVAAAPSGYVREGLVPLCFARPENNGSANGAAFRISLESEYTDATITGGYGACLWTNPGRHRIKVTWQGGGGVLVNTVVLVPKPRGLRLNVCVVVPKKPGPVGWALRRDGEKCSGTS